VRGPRADAVDGDEVGDGLLVGELVEPVDLQGTAGDVLGERAQVPDLGVREPGGDAQRLGVVVEDLLGRRRVTSRS
jgi:hypothetical protein